MIFLHQPPKYWDQEEQNWVSLVRLDRIVEVEWGQTNLFYHH